MKEPKGGTMSKRAWKLQEFLAHSANVNSVSLGHKSGRVLVTGGGDKKVNLWAVGKPNCIMSLSGHLTPVDCVRFSISEDQVCAGSQAGALKIWDLESARLLRTLTGHRASIRSVDFHPYGDFLASGSSDSGIKMWDIRKKGCIFGYKGHNSTVNSIRFSPDGQWIASGGDDNLVKIWDIRVGKVLSEFSDHNAPVTDVEFHPHEFLLASGSVDRTVKFWDLETFSLISSSIPDVPSVRCISFHPDGSCLYAASPETLRVHGWEPAEIYDSLPASWSKIQDIAITQDQLIGVTTQLTNVSIFVVDLRRVKPSGNSHRGRASLSAGNTLRKNFNTARSTEFEESLNAMKVNEDSDSFNTDLEDESFLSQPEIKFPTDFRQVFNAHRDLTRTPPPVEEFLPPTDDEPSSSLSQSTGTDPESPRPEPSKRSTKFKFVTTRAQRQLESESVRRSSVPSLNPTLSPSHSHLHANVNRSRSPDYLSSRQSSLSDDSSGPTSSRSMEAPRVPTSSYQQQPQLPLIRGSNLKHSPSEPTLITVNNKGGGGDEKGRGGNSLSPFAKPPLYPLPRSPERPLAQCQVKPMPKAFVPPEPILNNRYMKTEDDYCKPQDDFVPMSIDKPSGVAIDDFLPKKAPVAFQGGVQIVDIDESNIFANLCRDHQPIVSVLTSRQRNLRIIYNIWHSKDIKAALDTAAEMNDVALIVDLLGQLVLRPSIWNLDLCVTLLPSIMDLLQSRYEAHMIVGCDALRLILKNFASVIRTNIESPIQTVGVDISREERYKKSMDCYKYLVNIRAFTLKRQTLQGKTGHAFRELHILLSSVDS